jgi:hypothetical protein
VKLNQRDRRALALLTLAVVALAIFLLVSRDNGRPSVVVATGTIPAVERRLVHARQLAATVEGKQQILRQVKDELAAREKGIIQAETAPQAQAQLLEIVRRVARAQTPPIEIGNVELQPASRLGDYGEARIAVVFTCQIEDLVNLLADLTKQPEAIATSGLRIIARDSAKKTISVRLTVSGAVPRSLAPEKKGLAAF